MPDDLACPPHALLPPTVALLRGFVFDEAAPAPVLAAIAGTTGEAGAAVLREGFRIGELRMAIRYEDGNELTDLPPVYMLPRAPSWFRGMANLHGTLVPVFDVATLFGVNHDESAKPMLLVLGHGDEKAGLVIDGLPSRLRLGAADRMDGVATQAALAGCAAGAWWSDGKDWVDLEVDALLRLLADELAGAAS